MMFLKTTKGTSATYLYLVEGYRENGKVKHRILTSFGKLEDLDQTQLKDIAVKLLGLCGGHNLIDVNNANELCRKNWGIPKVIDQLWQKFRLDDFFNQLIANRSIKYNLPAAIKLMLADRLSNPCSKYQTYLYSNYYDGLINEKLHNIYRSLNELCANKLSVERHLFEQSKAYSYLELDVVFFDVTTFHFESVKQDEIRDFGYSKACKFNEVQVVLSLFIGKNGMPLGFDVFPGNTYEGHTLIDAIRRLKNDYKIKKVIVVADRGINTGVNLQTIKDEDFEYIVGSRIKSLSKAMQKKILDDADFIVSKRDDDGNELFKYKIIDYDKKIKIGKKYKTIASKLVCTWSAKRAKKDACDRERLINKAKKIIQEGDNSTSRGAKKYLSGNKQEYQLNEEKIINDARWDGYYGLETSDHELSSDAVLSAYAQLWKIEESFRLYKSHLETRPLYHWNPERIQGHFVLSYIAFLFERTLEIELTDLGINVISPTKIRDSINKMEFSEIEFGNNKHKIYAPIDELGSNILKILNIKMPKERKKHQIAA